MSRKILSGIVLLLAASPMAALARNAAQSPTYGFIENKGQVVDQNHQPNNAVRYLLNTNGLNVQLRANGFSYDAYTVASTPGKPHTKGRNNTAVLNQNNYNYHRVDVVLDGANTDARVVTEQPGSEYLNYTTPANADVRVHHYGKVTYKDIYKGIDMEFVTTATKAIEYNFIVHPGADAGQIKLRYTGANNVQLKDDKIDLALAHGHMQEKIPASFIQSTGKPVAVHYRSAGTNTYGYTVGDYDHSKTLVIDPTPDIHWGTYVEGSGGAQFDQTSGHTITTSGINVYMAGVTNAVSNLATTGAHQNFLGGANDGFITKFTKNGERLWTTYVGGSGYDIISGIAADMTGNIAIGGNTASPSMIATGGTHQTSINAQGDGFVMKFDANGTRLWGTYYGDFGDEQVYSVAMDASGNVFACGYTESNTGFTTVNTMQTSYAGNMDGFVVKLNSNGVRVWGTYIGGDAVDEATCLAIDTWGDIYVSGSSDKHNTLTYIPTPGSHQFTHGGNTDAFLVKLTSAGQQIWGTFYGGTGADHAAWTSALALDALNNVVMCGTSYSASGIATLGALQTSQAGQGDGFVVKFDNMGARQWGTYRGGGSNDMMMGVGIDAAGDIYAAGTTASTTGLATANPFQSANGGFGATTDVYLTKLSPAGGIIYGTFFGGTGNDQLNAMAVDADKHLFVTGTTNSPGTMATIGAYDATLSGSNAAFISRFDVCPGSTLPTIVGATEDVSCHGLSDGAIYVTGTGAGELIFVNLTTGLAQDTFKNLAAGTYQFLVTDQNACKSTANLILNEPAKLVKPVINGPAVTDTRSSGNYITQLQGLGVDYLWTVKGGTIVGGQGTNVAIVDWVNYGQGEIKVKVTNGMGKCSDSAIQAITVNWPTGIAYVAATGISIYPNPATNMVHVVLQNAPAHNAVLQLHDGFGKLVLQQNLQKEQNIDISKLPAGVYHLNAGGVRSKVTKL